MEGAEREGDVQVSGVLGLCPGRALMCWFPAQHSLFSITTQVMCEARTHLPLDLDLDLCPALTMSCIMTKSGQRHILLAQTFCPCSQQAFPWTWGHEQVPAPELHLTVLTSPCPLNLRVPSAPPASRLHLSSVRPGWDSLSLLPAVSCLG